jgi:raffinose/stachyose/melibiose transport system permease protein
MIYKTIKGFLLTVFALAIIIPCSIVIMGAFKTDLKIISEPLALPESWNFDNFKRLIDSGSVYTPAKNSLIVAFFSVLITLFLASLAAFAISRLITVTGKILFVLFSVGLAIPGQVNIIPIYLLFVDLGLTNSLTGLVLVNIALTLPISIFIMTAFFRDLPKEMFEVAGIDGAGPWRIYRSIALPLSRPAIGATGIFLFVICWNDLLYPLMLITREDKKTLPLTLIDFRGEYLTEYSMIFTAILVASLPMVIMYIAFQRSFIAGLTQGAVKG